MSNRGLQSVGLIVLVSILASGTVLAGFAGTDVFVPSVGRRPGAAGSQWYTTVWIHNPSSSTANVTINFLERNVANPTPQSFSESVPAGDTRRYANALWDLFRVEKYGALRVTSSTPVLVTCRMFNQPPGGEDKDTQGQDHAAIPASFAIASGQATQLLGVFQTSPKESSQFRYNFGWVESAGGTANVRAIAYEDSGAEVARKDYPTTGPFEPRFYAVEDLLGTFSTTNVRIELRVTSGSGKIIGVGSGVSNRSNDATSFEMSFRSDLLGGGSSSNTVSHDGSMIGDGTPASPLGIASNGIGSGNLADGAVTPRALNATGTPIAGDYLTFNGANFTWQPAPTGGSGGLSSVNHDFTLTGNGSLTAPMGIAANGVTGGAIAVGAVTPAKINFSGAMVGQVLKFDGVNVGWANDNAGGITLPYSGSASTSGDAFAITNTVGNFGALAGAHGVAGSTTIVSRSGVFGDAAEARAYGVYGRNYTGAYGYLGGNLLGVSGYSPYGGYGVVGEASGDSVGSHGKASGENGGTGVWGLNTRWNSQGLLGTVIPSASGHYVIGVLGKQSPEAFGGARPGWYTYAGYFTGRVGVEGDVVASGSVYKSGGSFRIDHPLEPADKYLLHSFVESPDMMNVYNGNVVLDERGEARIELPVWFEALNRDFRYQLTAIGSPGPNLYVAEEVSGNRFKIAGGQPNTKVSWQVTGIRQDAWANAHRIPVESDKPTVERGYYLHPELFGQPPEKRIGAVTIAEPAK